MQRIEWRVQREARAMTQREVITKAIAGQPSWVQAAAVLGVTARHMRRVRRGYERWGMSAVMDQRGRRRRRKRISLGTIEMLCRLKREVMRTSRNNTFTSRLVKASGQGVLRLVATDVAESRDGGQRTSPG